MSLLVILMFSLFKKKWHLNNIAMQLSSNSDYNCYERSDICTSAGIKTQAHPPDCKKKIPRNPKTFVSDGMNS